MARVCSSRCPYCFFVYSFNGTLLFYVPLSFISIPRSRKQPLFDQLPPWSPIHPPRLRARGSRGKTNGARAASSLSGRAPCARRTKEKTRKRRKKKKGKETKKRRNDFRSVAVAPQLAPFVFGDEAANAGEMATVQCAAIKGDLPLRIVWSLNGRPIDVGRVSGGHGYDTADIVVTRGSKRISTLTIDSVAARHAGEYKCTATNAAGSAAHTSVLSVNGTLWSG